MKKPRLVPLALAATLALSGAPARAALPDSGMADTAPAPPAVGPAVERPSAPPSGAPSAARPGSPDRRKARAAAKRPTPPRAAAEKAPAERTDRDG